MKSGFTLIELSIGILLSGIIATALYNAFYVTHRVVDSSDNFITVDFRSSILDNQLEKDLGGLFVPEEPDLIKKPVEKKPGDKTEDKKPEAKKETTTVQEKPPAPIEKIFYSINGPDDSLNVLTFVTNNPVKVYEKAKNVSPKPRIVRVAYRLVAHEDDPKVFSLMRQESSDLDFQAFDPKSPKSVRAYELADNVKNLKIEYLYPVQKKEEPPKASPAAAKEGEKKKAPEEKKPKPEYKTIKIWDMEAKKEEPQEQPKIPQFITLHCELWDNKYQRDYAFTFNYEIITFASNIKPKRARKQPTIKGPEKESAEQKPKEPSATPEIVIPKPPQAS